MSIKDGQVVIDHYSNTVLLSSRVSNIAHLSWDGEDTACGTPIIRGTLRGVTLDAVKADTNCLHCPEEAFKAFLLNNQPEELTGSILPPQNRKKEKKAVITAPTLFDGDMT